MHMLRTKQTRYNYGTKAISFSNLPNPINYENITSKIKHFKCIIIFRKDTVI